MQAVMIRTRWTYASSGGWKEEEESNILQVSEPAYLLPDSSGTFLCENRSSEVGSQRNEKCWSSTPAIKHLSFQRSKKQRRSPSTEAVLIIGCPDRRWDPQRADAGRMQTSVLRYGTGRARRAHSEKPCGRGGCRLNGRAIFLDLSGTWRGKPYMKQDFLIRTWASPMPIRLRTEGNGP